MLGGGTRMQGCQPTCKPLMRLPDGERFFVRALESLSNPAYSMAASVS